MSDTTMEEAKRCPKCKQPGEDVMTRPADGGTVHVFQCANERCPRVRDRWLVQVRPDGSIPNRETDKGGAEKEFPAMNESWLATGRRQVEDAVMMDLRTQEEIANGR